jgi:hypothetical protein
MSPPHPPGIEPEPEPRDGPSSNGVDDLGAGAPPEPESLWAPAVLALSAIAPTASTSPNTILRVRSSMESSSR